MTNHNTNVHRKYLLSQKIAPLPKGLGKRWPKPTCLARRRKEEGDKPEIEKMIIKKLF
jgi:hypothetical protein